MCIIGSRIYSHLSTCPSGRTNSVQTVEDHIYLLASAPKEDILFSTMKRAFLGPKVEAEMCNPY